MKSVTNCFAPFAWKAFVTHPCQRFLLLFGVTALLTGCATGALDPAAPIHPMSGPQIRGKSFGGQQPIVGASIQLYAANLSGYGNAAIPLLPPNTVTSDSGGNFSITGQYTCPVPDVPVYLVATGGNPGASSSNPNLALMAALGSCSGLQANASTTFIQMNEVTTVAAAYALAPFMTGIAGMSTSPINMAGLNFAFADVDQLVNNSTGTSPGTALPQDASLPLPQIYALADSVAACVNSSGGTAGDRSACGTLFAAATPSGGTAPTDTVSAVLDIVQHPAKTSQRSTRWLPVMLPFSPRSPARQTTGHWL